MQNERFEIVCAFTLLCTLKMTHNVTLFENRIYIWQNAYTSSAQEEMRV